MEFNDNEIFESIREGIRRICDRFPDEYWSKMDSAHEFPWKFYEQVAEGGWILSLIHI